MRPLKNRRQEIRQKLREATERRKRAASDPAPPPTALVVSAPTPRPAEVRPRRDSTPVGEIRCVCGKSLTIFRSDDRKQVYCVACERAIKIGIVQDPVQGSTEIVPVFSEEGPGLPPPTAPTLDELLLPEAAPAEKAVPVGPELPEAALEPLPEEPAGPAASEAAPEPPPTAADGPPPPAAPPSALAFKCVCRRGMVARSGDYGGRIRCHRCGTWLGIEPAFDAAAGLWRVVATPTTETAPPA